MTLRVEEGEIFGSLGPDGAGKTTTVRMLCCLISKTSGDASIAGYDVGNQADSLILPFAGVHVGGEIGILPLGNTGTLLLIIAGILLAIDPLLLYVARATFRRGDTHKMVVGPARCFPRQGGEVDESHET